MESECQWSQEGMSAMYCIKFIVSYVNKFQRKCQSKFLENFRTEKSGAFHLTGHFHGFFEYIQCKKIHS